MAPKQKEHLFNASFSKYLVIRNMKKHFKKEMYNQGLQ